MAVAMFLKQNKRLVCLASNNCKFCLELEQGWIQRRMGAEKIRGPLLTFCPTEFTVQQN